MKTIQIKTKNILKSKINDFIFNSTMVKAELKRKITFIENKDDIRKFFIKRFVIFSFERFYIL